MNRLKLVFFDAETTGPDPLTDVIIELAMVSSTGDIFHGVFNPGRPIPPEATAIHGFTTDNVMQCPAFEADAETVQRMIQDAVLVGYNSRHFDAKILHRQLTNAGLPGIAKDHKQLDLYILWQEAERRTLENCARRYLGKVPPETHRAVQDVRTTMLLMDAMLTHHQLTVSQAIDITEQSDITRWAEKRDGTWRWKFGKNRGKPIKADLTYANWVLAKDFPDALKHLIRTEIMSCVDEDDYYRRYWGGAPCPVCGATLDETGRRHVDGSQC
jgi:DNA polymerase III subunit epsilon